MSIVSSAAVLLLACGPGLPSETVSGGSSDTSSATTSDSGATTADPGNPGTTDSSPSDPTAAPTTDAVTTGDVTTSFETGFETDSATGTPPPEPGVPLDQFTCDGVRWLFIDPQPSAAGRAFIDSRDHLRLSRSPDLLDFDPDGVLVDTLVFDPPFGLGGFDAESNLYLSFRNDEAPVEERRRWLRKFDVAGQVQWEIDRGPSPNAFDFAGTVAVAPDGTTLVSARGLDRVERYTADGGLVFDKELPGKPFDEARAMNSAGVAAAVRHTAEGAVLALAPDASVLWEQPVAFPQGGLAEIDEQGRVTAVPQDSPLEVLRWNPDGTLAWHLQFPSFPGLGDVQAHAMAVSEAGETAVAGTGFAGQTHTAFAVKFDADGQLTALKVCSSTSDGDAIALDASGMVYLAGRVWAEDGPHSYAVALE